ncbi:MAG: ORF6N domain-containing protein [Clostridia bacterium]|nr:ORF6N domain-containing protein [Clostridia bacterium]
MSKEIKSTELITQEQAAITESTIDIRSMIHIVRGQQVMMDYDLAFLYQVETKRLNERVKRNANRFPESFCFQLTREEFNDLRSQNATSSEEYGGRRYLPYAFTEQGIAMLSAVLRSDVAVDVSVRIMNSFVEMRRFLASNALLFERISAVELKQLEYQKKTDERLEEVFAYISNHIETDQKIFFEGQIYDAFSLLVDIIKKAKKDIVLIDGYVDGVTLDMLSKKKKGVSVRIHTYPKSKLTETDISKFNSQYPNLVVTCGKEFHDRFLILDQKTVYHIGASIKDAGMKCFALSLMRDMDAAKDILEKI